MIDDVVRNWSLPFVQTHKKSTFRDFLRVLADPYYRIGVDIDTLYEERFLRFAHGTQLKYMGEAINVYRREGESEESFRKRIQVAYEIASSDGSWRDFSNLVLSIFETEPSKVTIEQDDSYGLTIRTTQNVIDESTYTISEMESELESAINANRPVSVIPENVATFGEDGKGFGEAPWG